MYVSAYTYLLKLICIFVYKNIYFSDMFRPFTSFMMEIPTISKPVDEPAEQVNGLVSVWLELPSWKSWQLFSAFQVWTDKKHLEVTDLWLQFVISIKVIFFLFFFFFISNHIALLFKSVSQVSQRIRNVNVSFFSLFSVSLSLYIYIHIITHYVYVYIYIIYIYIYIYMFIFHLYLHIYIYIWKTWVENIFHLNM